MRKELLRSGGGVYREIVEETTDFALIVLDERGAVELWNRGAQEIFGWTAEEAAGRYFDFIFLPAEQEASVPENELGKAREFGFADDTRWQLAKNGRMVFVDGMTRALRDEDGTLAGYSKFCRDITDRFLTEQRLAAQLALTNLLNQEQPLNNTARHIMQIICENLRWDVGAFWEVERDVIHCVDVWQAPHVDPGIATDLCHGQRLKKGEGLIGEVWADRDAVWVTEFIEQERYPRAPIAERAGLRSAFAFPITCGGAVVGAMEFFSNRSRDPEPALMPVMTLIGAQLGSFIDRRRTLGALRESEELYRLVSETAQDAIFTMDEASNITFCNGAVERMFGWKPHELIGHPLDVLIPERLREAHRRGVARYLRTHRRNIPWTGVELPALHKDGHEFPCEISFGEWTREGRTVFTGFARDVTERQRAREELQEALRLEQQARADAEAARSQLERRAEEESSFRHLASALTGAVEMTEVLYEITNRATHVTRADGVYVERIVDTGAMPYVEVVSSSGRGSPPRGLRVSYPGSMSEEIMHSGGPVILAEMEGIGRSMAPYLTDTCSRCEVLVTPLIAENETLGALVLLNSRTSGRKFQDGDVVRARTLGDLTSLALRRVRLLEQEREAKEKAEAAVRVRDETLGIVSHDLRNPLTKIALSAELLDGAPPEQQNDLVETIQASARQMQRLIQDLLDVARVEAGRFAVERSFLDPGTIVAEVCASNEPLAQQKDQRIVCHLAPALPNICADHDRLVQVFANLIGNAIKFAPERGTIAIEATQENGKVQFSVRDNGPGIPEADLKHVFKPYWQAKKTAHMGAGLGLAIVRGIIEAHGGQVWAENAPGGGAVFTFTVPTE
jgi:PAS domain S-box-containing protein